MGSSQRGFAVLMTLGTALVLSGLAAGLLLAASTDAQVAAAFFRGLEARAAADAGVHRAMVDLSAMPDWDGVLEGTVRSGFIDGPPSGTRIVAGRATIALELVRGLADCGHALPCSDAELDAVTATRPWGADNPRWQLFASGPLASLLPSGSSSTSCYVLVMVADDPMDADGNPRRDSVAPAPGSGVIRLRSEAFCPAGAHRTVDVLVTRPASGAGLRVLAWHEPS